MNKLNYFILVTLSFLSLNLSAQQSKLITFEQLEDYTFDGNNLRAVLETEGAKAELSTMFKNHGEFGCTKDDRLERLEWCEIETNGLKVNFLAGIALNILKISSDQYSINYRGNPITIGMSVKELKELFPQLDKTKESRIVNKGHFGQRRVDMFVFWIGVENSYTTLSFEYDRLTETITEITLYVYN